VHIRLEVRLGTDVQAQPPPRQVSPVRQKDYIYETIGVPFV
jgi:hypothetical protein